MIAALLIAACSGPVADQAQYDLGEFYIAGPAQIEAGSSTLVASNSGEFAHTIVITGQEGGVIAATQLIQPGETVDLAVDLAPGRYQITCRIVAQTDDGRLVDHYEAGMGAMVEASG